MSNNGLMIGNAIQSGLNTYGQLQSIDAHKQEMGLREADAKMRAEAHQVDMQAAKQNERYNNARMRQLEEDELTRANQLVARKMRVMQGAGVEWTPDNQKLLSEYGRLSDPEYLLSDETGGAIDVAESVMRGERDMNDPAAINAYNRLLNVQRGATGGRQVQINRLYPSRNGEGVYVGLAVTNEDGSRHDKGVLTDRRSADPDDPVTELSMDELVDLLGTAKQMRGALGNPKMAQAFMDYYDPQPGSQVSAVDQSRINYNNSRANYYNEKAGNEKRGVAGGGNLPAKAQMVEYYRGMGYADDDAIAMANDSASSPEKFVTTYSRMLIESTKDYDGNSKWTPDAALEKALQVYRNNFQRKPAGKRDDGAKAAPAAPPALIARPDAAQPREAAKTPPPEGQQYYPRPSMRALEHLRKNPQTKDQFLATYGYLPK